MLANDENHPYTFCASQLKQEEQRLRSYWHYHADRGAYYHHQGNPKRSIQCFNECLRISKLLLYSLNDAPHQSGIELLYRASHNSCACFNLLQKASQGELILQNLYTQIVELCKNNRLAKEVRLEALSFLDKSLFSLSSQLAYMGKLTHLYQLIERTEILADSFSKALSTTKKPLALRKKP